MRKSLIHIFLMLALFAHSQDSTNQLKDTAAYRHLKNYQLKTVTDSGAGNALNGRINDITNLPSRRKWIVGAGTAVAYGSSFLLLNQAWYKDYPRSSFHSFNDAGEWMQMDKVGHAWTAYTTGKATTALWKWAGTNERSSVLLGAGTSLLYMLSIEYLDGRSAEWGWSWADVAADLSGTILFAVQEFGWKEQKIQLKFSSHKKNYGPSLNARADNLFGSGLPERLLKDYNAQTYWLSFNISSILKTENFPKWLNVSIGYGADGMFGGYQNIAYDKNGDIIFDRRDIKRYRQWYLAPDIDLTKIKTGSRFLRTVLFAANVLKFPSPALEFSSNKFRFHLLTF